MSKSDTLKRDMKIVASQRHNPFIRDDKVDINAYVEFVTGFNEFINHKPKPFRKIVDKIMKL